MQRTHLRLIAGRPVSAPPVLREEFHRTESPYAGIKRWLEEIATAIFAGLAILTVVWAFAAFMLSFGGR